MELAIEFLTGFARHCSWQQGGCWLVFVGMQSQQWPLINVQPFLRLKFRRSRSHLSWLLRKASSLILLCNPTDMIRSRQTILFTSSRKKPTCSMHMTLWQSCPRRSLALVHILLVPRHDFVWLLPFVVPFRSNLLESKPRWTRQT